MLLGSHLILITTGGPNYYSNVKVKSNQKPYVYKNNAICN
jgi:hypothetical protein